MEPHRQDGPPVFAPRDEAVSERLFVRRPSRAFLQGAALMLATVGYPLAWTVLATMSSLTALDRTLRHAPDPLRETLGMVGGAAFWTSWAAALVMASSAAGIPRSSWSRRRAQAPSHASWCVPHWKPR